MEVVVYECFVSMFLHICISALLIGPPGKVTTFLLKTNLVFMLLYQEIMRQVPRESLFLFELVIYFSLFQLFKEQKEKACR